MLREPNNKDTKDGTKRKKKDTIRAEAYFTSIAMKALKDLHEDAYAYVFNQTSNCLQSFIAYVGDDPEDFEFSEFQENLHTSIVSYLAYYTCSNYSGELEASYVDTYKIIYCQIAIYIRYDVEANEMTLFIDCLPDSVTHRLAENSQRAENYRLARSYLLTLPHKHIH